MKRSSLAYSAALLALLFASSLQAEVATTVPVVRVTTENPAEINVGKPATFIFSVANEGKTPANGVFVVVSIPEHVELTSSTMKPTKVADNVYKFQVGDLAPKTTQRVALVAIPHTTDPIHLDSTVIFATSARASVVVRRPELSVAARAPANVVIGTEVDWTVSVTNTGDGPATDVIVTPKLTAGEVEGAIAQAVRIGSLKAGETKEVQFTVMPSKKGMVTAEFTASNPDELAATQQSTFRVLQAELSVAAFGPKVQPMGREGLYEVQVSNPGDASTGTALITVQIPAGLEVTAATENAYHAESRTLRWRITKVRPGTTVPIRFQAEPIADGDQTLNVIAKTESTGEATAVHTTNVISRPNPVVTVVSDQEYSPVGTATGFRVTIINAGSKAAEGLTVRVTIPEGMEAVESGSYDVVGGMIEFPAQQLESGEKITLAFHAIGREAGEHRVRISVDGISLSRELTFEGCAYCYDTTEASAGQQTAESSRREIQ